MSCCKNQTKDGSLSNSEQSKVIEAYIEYFLGGVISNDEDKNSAIEECSLIVNMGRDLGLGPMASLMTIQLKEFRFVVPISYFAGLAIKDGLDFSFNGETFELKGMVTGNEYKSPYKIDILSKEERESLRESIAASACSYAIRSIFPNRAAGLYSEEEIVLITALKAKKMEPSQILNRKNSALEDLIELIEKYTSEDFKSGKVRELMEVAKSELSEDDYSTARAFCEKKWKTLKYEK
jgi:hypothetical protein